jgi:hypothetical protein
LAIFTPHSARSRASSGAREKPSARVDDEEAVAAVGGVDRQRAETGDLEPGVEPVGEGGHVAHADALGLAVPTRRGDLDEPARRLQDHGGERFLHRHDAGIEQHGGDADGIRARHRRRVGGLHDDEAHLRPRVLGRHEEIDVAKDAAARFVEHEIAQGLIARDEARLLPQRVAGRRRDAADDDVADFAGGVAAHDMDDLGRSHGSFPPGRRASLLSLSWRAVELEMAAR